MEEDNWSQSPLSVPDSSRIGRNQILPRRHLKALADRCGGKVVRVACLRCLNRACAEGAQRDHSASYRTDSRSRRCELYRKTGRGGRADRERRRPKGLTRQCPERDALGRLYHRETLAHRRGSSVIAVTCLRRLDGAGAGANDRDSRARYRADRQCRRSEAYRQPGCRRRADRDRRRSKRLPRKRSEGDALGPLRHLETLVYRCGGGICGAACLVRLNGTRAAPATLPSRSTRR